MPSSVQKCPSRTGPGLVLAVISVLAAVAWLVSRAIIGLDFTDEMQYYGEIASLTRTGKFFQDDLFIQQLGYVFLWPFFKLHALLFPDQSYLVLFGRALMVAGYGAAGTLFWRSASKLDFPVVSKLAGLAAFAAWVPFQIFAPSYNSMAYLLIVGLVAVWLGREQTGRVTHLVAMAGLLAALTFVYPPAGLTLIALAAGENAWRHGLRSGLQLAALTLLAGLLVTTIILRLHPDFMGDLLTALEFSRAFSVGHAISQPDHLGGWAMLVLIHGVFVARAFRSTPFSSAPGSFARAVHWSALAVLVIGWAVSIGAVFRWSWIYFPVSCALGFLMFLASSSSPGEAKSREQASHREVFRRVQMLALGGGGLTMLMLNMRWATGFFAASLQVLILTFLAFAMPTSDRRSLVALAVLSAVLGTVFSFSSGNGLHNFGIGAAAVTPFLVLFCARPLAELRLPSIATQAVLPLLAPLILLNGLTFPYRERPGWSGFRPVRDIPAFKGIWTSPLKHDALRGFGQLAGGFGRLRDKRVLVAGPHPWIYFASGGQPATSMLFMHFTGGEKVDEMVARRLFRGGEPEVIFVTNGVPPPLHAKLMTWMGKKCTVRKMALSSEFTRDYFRLVAYEISSEILMLEREPTAP